MLEMASVSWKNFLSYGDYVTNLDLSNLGQCLITGEVLDEDDKEAFDGSVSSRIRKSNGAGKSTIPSVIQWVLFGRTMHGPNPGDAIVNWFTGKDCWGQITFKNGDSITRTRNTQGHNELIVVRDGDETKSTAETLSTAQAQQVQLVKTFGLDWEIFCGSTFFSQYGLPWMEMADQTRKKALERLLHVDRFSYYSRVAKAKSDKLDAEVHKLNGQKETLEREIGRLEQETIRLKEASAKFDTSRATRQEAAKQAALEEFEKRDAIQLPDLDKLKSKWDIIRQIGEKIESQRAEARAVLDESNSLDSSISHHTSNADAMERKIRLWKEKGGKICTACEQEVPHQHVDGKIEPLQEYVTTERKIADEITSKQNGLKTKYQQLIAAVKAAEQVVTQKRPAMTMRDAQAIHDQWRAHDREGKRQEKLIQTILEEENPHEISAQNTERRIQECHSNITKITGDVQRQEVHNRHYSYVARAYTDRNKIKSFVFREHVPFINSRLRHYLDVFGLDIHIELTDALGINSNLWNYKYESGGERKRTDVAFMLATFDFHEHMYGRQSNVLVLDEVDGRLDDDGIDSLINVIKNDLSNRVETIFIISHRNMMHDTFPREIKVTRKNRFSSLELV